MTASDTTFATQTQRPAPRLNTFHNSNKNNRHGPNKPKLTKFKSPVKYRLLLDTRATLAALKQSLQVVENVSKEGGYAIHREPPKFEELTTATEVLFTGIKVIDLIEPYAKGGKIGLF